MVKKTLVDLVKLILPLSNEKKEMLSLVLPYLDDSEIKSLTYFLKMDKLFGYVRGYNSSFSDRRWVEFKSHIKDDSIHSLIKSVNMKVKEGVDNEAFSEFSKEALSEIPKLIANNIVGLDDAKLGAALLLFAKEPVHLLYLGDPGTGKTEILRSIAALAPKSVFGLGSGISGVGLAATFKGNKLIKGLLPSADGGVACIDELNLMKVKDRAAFYNAMEKGFVTYDKGGKSVRFPARVRIAATANPKGDRFVGKGSQVLKKQIPFSQALISRFHMVFLIRKPSADELGTIAKQIISDEHQKLRKGDVDFVKSYIGWVWGLDVVFDKKFEPTVVDFIENLADDEDKFIVEVGPRTVVGVIRLTKALSRMQAKNAVGQKDLLTVLKLLKRSLYVRSSKT